MAKRSFLDYFFTESTLVGIPTAFGSVFVEASSRELASALRSRVLIPALIRSGPAGARKFVIRECWMLEYPSHSGPSGRLPSMVLGIGLCSIMETLDLERNGTTLIVLTASHRNTKSRETVGSISLSQVCPGVEGTPSVSEFTFSKCWGGTNTPFQRVCGAVYDGCQSTWCRPR